MSYSEDRLAGSIPDRGEFLTTNSFPERLALSFLVFVLSQSNMKKKYLNV